MSTTTPRARHRAVAMSVLIGSALTLAACGGGGSDDATTAGIDGVAESIESPTTEPSTTTTTEPEPAAITSADLAAILPAVEEFGGGFVDVAPPATPDFVRDAMAERCPGALAVTESPAGAVEAAYATPEGVTVALELAPNVSPMTPDEEADLVEALNECTFTARVDGVLHSVVFAASADSIGDQAVRGAITDSLSSADQPSPVGVNTYFVRVVVGDVAILVRGIDGFDGTVRAPFDSEQMAPLTQEMVARVEQLSAG